MSPTVVNRRKVDRYAQLLDESRGGPHHHSRSPLDNELSMLVGLGSDLNDMGSTTRANVAGPTEQWKLETRARLMAAIERDGMGATEISPDATVAIPKIRRYASARPGGSRIRARGAILVGLAVGTLALSGMSAASGTAMPGDTLYPLKRSQERAQLALATSDAAKGKLYLQFASTRLAEASHVTGDRDWFTSTMNDLEDQAKLGVSQLASDAVAHHSQASLNQINTFVSRTDVGLASLMNQVRRDHAEFDLVAEVQGNIDVGRVRAANIEKLMPCPTIPTLGTDAWGPRPAASCQGAAPSPSGTAFTPEKSTRTKKPSTDGKNTGSGQGPANPTGQATPTGDATATIGTAIDSTGPDQSDSTGLDQTGSSGLLGDISHLLGGLIGH